MMANCMCAQCRRLDVIRKQPAESERDMDIIMGRFFELGEPYKYNVDSIIYWAGSAYVDRILDSMVE